MKKFTVAAATLLSMSVSSMALAQDGLTVGVSWSNFQEERWKTDEAAIKSALDAAGAEYVSSDAQSSSAKQLSDVESLIAQGVDALIILAQDSQAIGPAVQQAADEGIPVVGYDRLIDDPRAFYLTFDNVEVGRKITIVGEAYTDAWLPANAQRNMEQILTAQDNAVDAVVASNDGTAGGAVAALTAQGMDGIPVSGQDGDHAALNRVAKGTQTVSVWKDARELGKRAAEIAVSLADGTAPMDVEGAEAWTSPAGTELTAVFLDPIPVTQDNLNVVVDAGWIEKDALCQGVTDGPAVCN